ncbi:hypothetical protein ACIGXM_27980 [Kitasatospora sp. NPDC052896]|uniref:hypothetical protein n=1 Tax=Kitasatospora sp. NPDC052896 TaxID=3364061 RepID=UPI0037C98484
MRALPHPESREGTVVLGVLTLLAMEIVALGLTPVPARPAVGGVLLAVAALGLALGAIALVVHAHRRRQAGTIPPPAPAEPDDEPFAPEALDGFPLEAVRRFLPDPAAPVPESLHTAWVLATHGHDADWLAHHLDLPAGVSGVLVAAARQHQGLGGAVNPAPPKAGRGPAPGPAESWVARPAQ